MAVQAFLTQIEKVHSKQVHLEILEGHILQTKETLRELCLWKSNSRQEHLLPHYLSPPIVLLTYWGFVWQL